MLYGRVVRPPAVVAELLSTGDPELPPGVVTVRDGSFLGVVAPADATALRAARLIAQAARWQVTESLPDADDLKGFLLSAPAEEVPVESRRDEGAAATASTVRTAEYTRPFLAHASMAPSCAIARWDGGAVTVWSHSQGVFALRDAIAAGLGLDAARVTVNHAEGAGAYGHNGADDAALDAVLLARAVPGRPVRVLWSREDEMAWAPLGSAMLARLSAGLDARGKIVTWRQHVWSNGFIGRPGRGGEPRLLALAHLAGGRPMPPAPDGPPTGAMGSTRNAVPGYDIPDLEVVRHRLLTMPIRTSSLRSLGAFLNVFAIESFLDELAECAGADPVEFRLAHLTDPRAVRVIEAAADLAGWAGRPRAEGTGYGLGYARYKGLAGYCAAVAEVEAESDVRVRRLWLAVDVGTVINPDGVINQVEGGAVQSASWATRERVTFDRARITSVSWDTYPVLRFTEVPEVAVRIVAAPGQPETGAGEIAQGPVAAAIGNALARRDRRAGARPAAHPRAGHPRDREQARSRQRCAGARSRLHRSGSLPGPAGAPDPRGPQAAQCWPNSALTDSPTWIRRIASARAGATDSTVSLPVSPGSGGGTVFVQTISVTSGAAAIRSSAPSANSPWVHAMRTDVTRCSRSLASISISVVPRAISSSSTITSRSSTSPMIEVMRTVRSSMRSLAPGGNRQAQPGGERGRALGVAEVRGDDHGPGEVLVTEVAGQFPQRVQVVHRHREEPVHLAGVQGHREHPAGPGADQQVGHHPPADRHPWHVLLVAARVGSSAVSPR